MDEPYPQDPNDALKKRGTETGDDTLPDGTRITTTLTSDVNAVERTYVAPNGRRRKVGDTILDIHQARVLGITVPELRAQRDPIIGDYTRWELTEPPTLGISPITIRCSTLRDRDSNVSLAGELSFHLSNALENSDALDSVRVRLNDGELSELHVHTEAAGEDAIPEELPQDQDEISSVLSSWFPKYDLDRRVITLSLLRTDRDGIYQVGWAYGTDTVDREGEEPQLKESVQEWSPLDDGPHAFDLDGELQVVFTETEGRFTVTISGPHRTTLSATFPSHIGLEMLQELASKVTSDRSADWGQVLDLISIEETPQV